MGDLEGIEQGIQKNLMFKSQLTIQETSSEVQLSIVKSRPSMDGGTTN